MKLRIKNYRRFIVMALLSSLLLFVICWGLVSIIQNTVLNRNSQQSEVVVAEETIKPKNPNSPYLILVNTESPLDADYEPTDLTEIKVNSDETLYMTQEAASQINRLFEAAEEQGLDLVGISAYRSYEDQQALNDEAIEVNSGNLVGMENTEGGTSEHQTGLALDVASDETDYTLRQDFATTKAGQWIIENADDYGFIIRYPQGKETQTGNIYEPWHLRYVGLEDAKKITDNNLTLEEYIGWTAPTKTANQETSGEDSQSTDAGKDTSNESGSDSTEDNG